PVAIAKLPGAASDVRTIRTDAGGDTLLVDVGGHWYWMTVPPGSSPGSAAAPGPAATPDHGLTALPCAAGAARLTADGQCVLCSDEHGKAWLMRLADQRGAPRDLPASAAGVVERDGVRSLVWADAPGAPVQMRTLSQRDARVVAPKAPLRGLLVAPDGGRAVGVYRAPAVGQPPVAGDRDQLFGFALDGIAAPRRLIRDGVVLDWSWDSKWLLVQDHGSACVVRAIGGEYKCWKGYTAVSFAPDGSYALVVGPRDGAPAPAAGGGGGDDDDGEGGEGEGEADSADGGGGDEAAADPVSTAALPKGPLSLYRARLAGAYSEPPAVVAKVVDGAAAWLP
ncbi:MAG TPA: hypothetical protein VHE35_17755, partial [Kofleriaceae bacterium]|nr:hypothetical protein [Kofleriaceae bacterium]